jgi:hypothetical protein
MLAGRNVCYGTISLVVPAMLKVITPPQLQLQVELFCRAGMPRTVTVGEPGAQGAAVTGTQGIGVNTPSAAAVAAATVGLAIELHIPNGGMLAMGLLSMMLAAGFTSPVTVGTATIRLDGATPKLHVIIALIATNWAMV